MNLKRRDFVGACAATFAYFGSGFVIAASGSSSSSAAGRAAIEKSIKASFGGGFSLLSYSMTGSSTSAKIENSGNQYTVTSVNLLDWKIIKSSLSN